MNLPQSVPNISAPKPAIPSSTNVSDLPVKLPTVKLPNPTEKLSTLTRGALPEPKLGISGLKTSIVGPVNIKNSMIDKMTPALAKMKIPGTGMASTIESNIASAKSTISNINTLV